MPERGPCALGPLFTIKGAFASRTLAPALRALSVNDMHQHDAPRGRATETGLKKIDERQTYLTQLDRFNNHNSELHG
jgi:hypothetical protein